MRTSKTVLQRLSFPGILFFVCLLGLGIGGVTRKGQNGIAAQSKAPRIQNKTRSFEVAQVRPNLGANSDVELSLRNGYNKNITAWAVSVNGSITEIDFAYSELEDQSGISPQMVHTQSYPFARHVNPADAPQSLDITILAVVFDDKSSDGDPKLVAEILDTRLGSKIQLTRIIELLNKALNTRGVLDEAAMVTLKSRISSLPIDSAQFLAESSRERLRGEKGNAIKRLDQFAPLSPEERIRTLKEIYESLVGRL